MRPQFEIRHVEDNAEINSSFSVMKELRPHLNDRVTYAVQIEQQKTQGYRLLAAWNEDVIVGLAGYRLQNNLLYGRFIYVDDLVVTSTHQGTGIGATLLDATRQQAIAQCCQHFVLDTGLHMALAQRFYFRQRLLAKGMHFVEALTVE